MILYWNISAIGLVFKGLLAVLAKLGAFLYADHIIFYLCHHLHRASTDALRIELISTLSHILVFQE